MGRGDIVQQAADPQHTHSYSSYSHSTDTLLSNLFPISAPGRVTLRDYPDPAELAAFGAHNG